MSDISRPAIETDVPLPKPRTAMGTWAPLAKQMGRGDSLLLPDRNAAHAISTALRNLGRGTTQKKLDDGTYRVWRTT